MSQSGQKLGEKPPRGGGGLRRDFAGREAAELSEEPARIGNIGGFGKEMAIFADEVRRNAVGKGRRQVGGVGFEEKMAVRGARGVFPGADIFGSGEGAAEGDACIFRGEGFEGVGGAGIGVDEESGGVWRQGKENFEHGVPGVAAVQAGGKGEFIGKVELGAEDGFAVGVEAVIHAGVEADLADAGGAVGEDAAEILQPAGAAPLDEPRVNAEGADREAGMGIRQGAYGGPIGFAGGIDVEQRYAGGAGSGKDFGKMGGEARILQVAVGIGPNEILTVRRRWGCYVH